MLIKKNLLKKWPPPTGGGLEGGRLPFYDSRGFKFRVLLPIADSRLPYNVSLGFERPFHD